MSRDIATSTDSSERMSMNQHKEEWFVWLLTLAMIAAAFVLVAIDRAYGGPRERIAIAEAAVWVAQNQFPAGENDYDKAGPSNNPDTTGQVQHENAGDLANDSDNPDISGQPRFEFPDDAGFPLSENVQQLECTIYTAEQFNGDGWCSRCNILKRDWGNGDDRLRLVWSRDRVSEGGEAIYPAIRFHGLKGYSMPSDEAGRYKIPATLGELAAIVEKHSGAAEASKAVAPSGAAGAIHAKGQIQSVFAWWRANIGDGVKAECRWDRSGAQSFPLLAKGDWSALAVFGKFGHVQMSANGAVNLPVQSLGFGYKVDGDDITIDADQVTLKGLGKSLNPTVKQSLTVEPSEIGPGTVLTIVSVIRGVWSLLNPTADLQLGGNVSATAVLTGDTLAVDFQQCPSIKLIALFTFSLRVERVEITETSLRVLFGGSRLVKERTFAVK